MEHLVTTVGVGPSDAFRRPLARRNKDLGSAMDVEKVSN